MKRNNITLLEEFSKKKVWASEGDDRIPVYIAMGYKTEREGIIENNTKRMEVFFEKMDIATLGRVKKDDALGVKIKFGNSVIVEILHRPAIIDDILECSIITIVIKNKKDEIVARFQKNTRLIIQEMELISLIWEIKLAIHELGNEDKNFQFPEFMAYTNDKLYKEALKEYIYNQEDNIIVTVKSEESMLVSYKAYDPKLVQPERFMTFHINEVTNEFEFIAESTIRCTGTPGRTLLEEYVKNVNEKGYPFVMKLKDTENLVIESDWLLCSRILTYEIVDSLVAWAYIYLSMYEIEEFATFMTLEEAEAAFGKIEQ